MSTMSLSFVHRFEPATLPGRPPLLLLHGTGGDESDLLPVGQAISPGSPLLSPRGKVLEHGMPRYFRRLAEGVFDEPDLVRRTHELADFIGEARAAYALAEPVAVGFSNGANIAAAMLLLRPEALAGAVLLRAMVPLASYIGPRYPAKPVLLLSGASDPIVAPEDAARLVTLLQRAGVNVRHEMLAAGHGLSQKDLFIARDWLERSFP
jgi:phospholipase/carboxylesterase